MREVTMSAKNAVRVAAWSVALMASQAVMAATIGFNQTAAGPWDYNTAGNWAGGTINGIWDSSLILPASQTTTFAANTTLLTGLTFNYDGSFNETLTGTGGDRTITLGGDILVNTVDKSRAITFGSGTLDQKLNVDLGGANRTFSVIGVPGTNNQRSLTFTNNVTNGSLVLTGGGNVNMNSANTLSALTLKGIAWAHNNTAGDTAISGALTIDGAAGGAGVITLSSSGSTHSSITASSLTQANGGVAFFRGATLGTGAPNTNNVNNITFASTPVLVGGGGAAASHNISIIPWAAGDTSTTGSGSGTTTFVTYDSTNGIRHLNIATEYDSSITDGTSTPNNVMLATGTTTTINSATTINSLITASGSNPTVLNGTGTLAITSGAVFLGGGNGTPNLGVTVDFGSRRGNIGYLAGKGTTISGAIQGSGGMVLFQASPAPVLGSGGTGATINGNAASSTYTGDTYFVGRANIGVNGFLPNGSRTGDVYVNGIIEAGTMTINGLNGNGVVARNSSGVATLSIGNNNANGNFSGMISSTFSLAKVGNSTQTLSGANTYTGNTIVSAGILKLGAAGSIASSPVIDTAAGATFDTTLQSLTMSSTQTYKFGIDPSDTGSAGLLNAAGLNITTGVANFTVVTTLNDAAYIFARYTSLTGSAFATVNNLPSGYAIDYNYQGANSIALVTIPEPTTMGLAMGVMSLSLLARRRRVA